MIYTDATLLPFAFIWACSSTRRDPHLPFTPASFQTSERVGCVSVPSAPHRNRSPPPTWTLHTASGPAHGGQSSYSFSLCRCSSCVRASPAARLVIITGSGGQGPAEMPGAG